ncbi:SusC/RagA family TonB-linked outer membrane protein [Chitinophaga costaii]|nr:SusC/RagA family TonB-linked outer membrane protein [Chitinophaga costaii]
MRFTTALLLAICLHVSAASFSQSITFSGRAVPMEKVFAAIKQQTGFVVWGKSTLLKQAGAVSVSVQNMPLTGFLDLLLKDQPISYKIAGNTIMLYSKTAPLAPTEEAPPANGPVTGHVTDSTGIPLIGATIMVVGSQQSTITNATGNFTLSVHEGMVIHISFIGYKTKEIVITPAMLQSGNLGNVVLSGATSSLDGLSVTANTGYQSIPKERATGSFGIITEKALSARMETSIMDRLEGTVPGLFMSNGSVNIRGIATLYGTQSPLYVVDGFPYEGDLDFINPSDVINVTVLKDAAASSIYGTRAANGVISITTRQGNNHKPRINFNSSVFITPIPDAGYMNLLNSNQMVDLETELFNMWHQPYSNLYRSGVPKATTALYDHEQGLISQSTLDSTLNSLRSANGQSQLEKLYMRNQVNQRYSFSANGGNDIHQYSLMMNYTGNRDDGFRTGGQHVNVGIHDQVKVFKWLDAEAGIYSNISKSTYLRESPESYYRNMPYEVLKNPDGSYAPFTKLKSTYEINRLISLGLNDETYNPLEELDKADLYNTSNYFRLQGGFTARIITGLTLDVKYQTERGTNYNKQYYSANSYFTKESIDDAAQLINGELVKNIPDGGQVYETRGDTKSYTVRAQLNYDRSFGGGKHHITALAGTERRAIAQSSTSVFRMGYSDNNLQFQPVDEVALNSLKGTESLQGTYSVQYNTNNNFSYGEDRYVSGYGNVGYTYNDKYNLTGSARVDNSNLFGTDPKYRYLPLWSVGASWRMSEEKFLKNVNWLSNLSLRATYGLGGNVARTVGPYLQAKASFDPETNAAGTDIIYPPNKLLRWEKTATTNIGIDFGFLNGRISGSADYYIRNTSDLLGQQKTDPTNAFTTALINFGSLNNKGIEVALNTVNIRHKNFSWNTTLSFSHNKNKMTKINTDATDVNSITAGYGVNRIGRPMDAMYNFKYAGLDPTNGTPLVYDAEGKIVKNYDASGGLISGMTDFNGLVYSGTMRPTYTFGLTNTFNWKQLTLNIILIGNGGNVMRDVVPILDYGGVTHNIDRRAANFWRQPGDEKKAGIMPAPDLKGNGALYYQLLWYASDKNTLKADYIKVRDISLSYSLPASVMRGTRLSAAKFTLQVKNPFHWYQNNVGIDPEAYDFAGQYANRTIPVMPTYMAGVDVTF